MPRHHTSSRHGAPFRGALSYDAAGGAAGWPASRPISNKSWYRVLCPGVAQAEGWAPVPPSQDPRGGPFNLIFCEGNDMGNGQ